MSHRSWIRRAVVLAALLPGVGLGSEASRAASPAAQTGARGEPYPGKRIVVCLDGTWNNPYKEKARYDARERRERRVLKPSNVLKTCRAVLPVAGDRRQITYYDIGVGALNKHPGLYNRLLRTADSVLGGAWGAGFETRIEDAYRFLVHNYEPGDEIFIFGFSRGAGGARGLTRFIDWMGGLTAKDDAYYIPIFFRAYENEATRKQGPAVVHVFDRPDFEIAPVAVRFLGVWDTVLALGSRFKSGNRAKAFHVGATPAAVVRTARQALAVDERRFDFRPEIWTAALPGQSVEQRWFAGVHSNIGGGYAFDGLANLALAWILSEADQAGLGLDWPFLFNYRPFPQAALYDSRKLFYRVKEAITFRRGAGTRWLVPRAGVDPEGAPIDVMAAGLSLDCSVLGRIASQPEDNPQMTGPYGPGTRSLLRYFATCDHHDEWFSEDLRRRVEKRRGREAGVCLPVSPTVFLSKRGPTLPNPECRPEGSGGASGAG